jgi:hypothetical protein
VTKNIDSELVFLCISFIELLSGILSYYTQDVASALV